MRTGASGQDSWRALEHVLSRRPALDPMALPDTTCDLAELAALWSADGVRHAVGQAAPALAAAVERSLSRADGQAIMDVLEPLRLYALRMATRPTPWGAMAAVGVSGWEPEVQEQSHHETVEVPNNKMLSQRERSDASHLGPTTEVVANPSWVHETDTRRVVFQVPGEDRQLAVLASPALLGLLHRVRTPAPAGSLGVPLVRVREMTGIGLLVSQRRPTAPRGFDPGRVESGSKRTLLRWVGAPPVDPQVRESLTAVLPTLEAWGRAEPVDPAVVAWLAAFEDRYGYEEVALDEAFDPMIGIGPLPESGTAPSAELDAIRLSLLERAGGGPRTELDPGELEELPALRDAPLSCDLFAEVSIDGGRPVMLAPRGAVAPGGRAWSRFAAVDARVDQLVGEIVKHERALRGPAEFALVDYVKTNAAVESPYGSRVQPFVRCTDVCSVSPVTARPKRHPPIRRSHHLPPARCPPGVLHRRPTAGGTATAAGRAP